jgi:hypothetical protein
MKSSNDSRRLQRRLDLAPDVRATKTTLNSCSQPKTQKKTNRLHNLKRTGPITNRQQSIARRHGTRSCVIQCMYIDKNKCSKSKKKKAGNEPTVTRPDLLH